VHHRRVAFSYVEHENIMLLRWRSVTLADLDAVMKIVRAMHTRVGRELIYIALIADDVDPPSGAVRSKMSAELSELCSMCKSVHTVMEGKGLRFTAVRSATAAVFLVSGNRKMHMSDSISVAARKAGLSEAELTSLIEAAVRNGISPPSTPS
jgi:hypothetical protein